MIPFGDLKAQYHTIKGEIDAAIAAHAGIQPIHSGQGSGRVRRGVRGVSGSHALHRNQFRDQRGAPGVIGGGCRARGMK